LDNRGAGDKIDFASFQLSDAYLMRRYCEYLHRSEFDLSRLAILSADQPVYSGSI